MTYSTAEGREPRFVVSEGNSHLGNIRGRPSMILVVLPYYVLNALGGQYEKEEKEEVGGGVADELQERFSAKRPRLDGL